MDLVEILKNFPKDFILYSPLVGEVKLKSLNNCQDFPIKVTSISGLDLSFTRDGRYFKNERNGECLLFPDDDCTWYDWENTIFKEGTLIESPEGEAFKVLSNTPGEIEVLNILTKSVFTLYTLRGFKFKGDFEEVKPFDLKPFDKILVRNDKALFPHFSRLDKTWHCTQFSHYSDKLVITTDSKIWEHYIPFNEETKHLIGTCDTPPNKYIIS